VEVVEIKRRKVDVRLLIAGVYEPNSWLRIRIKYDVLCDDTCNSSDCDLIISSACFDAFLFSRHFVTHHLDMSLPTDRCIVMPIKSAHRCCCRALSSDQTLLLPTAHFTPFTTNPCPCPNPTSSLPPDATSPSFPPLPRHLLWPHLHLP
jgi:hypothetical protein